MRYSRRRGIEGGRRPIEGGRANRLVTVGGGSSTGGDIPKQVKGYSNAVTVGGGSSVKPKTASEAGWIANADGSETGIKPIDTAIEKTLAFEQSHLGNPIVQFALLGLAVYGAYTLISKVSK